MSHLNKIFSQILLFVVALSTAGCVNDDLPDCHDTPGSESTATLRIRVKPADVSPASRSDIYYQHEDSLPDELMHTLRIIIVRPNGEVEHNRWIRLDDTQKNGVKLSPWEEFVVIANEGKTVYTFANEESLPDNGEVIRSIQPGSTLPSNFEIYTITQEEIKLPLFMSRTTTVSAEALDVSNNKDDKNHAMITVDHPVYILRAAVKFTFNITFSPETTTKPNGHPTDPIEISQILFRGLVDSEFLLPNQINNITASNQMVTQYYTPRGLVTGEKIFKTFSPAEKIAVGEKKSYGPYYYNEAPVWNSTEVPFVVPEVQLEETSPYSMALIINERLLDGAFNNLPALPRNTHVIVNMTVKDATVECVVELVPYIGVVLNPGFGFLDEENKDE